MTIASKINTLVAFTAAIAACLLIAMAAQREYNHAHSLLRDQTEEFIQYQSTLRAGIRDGNTVELGSSLLRLQKVSPSVRYGLVRDPGGTIVRQWRSTEYNGYQPPSLASLRGDAAVSEITRQARSTDVVPHKHELLSALSGGEVIWDVTIPVFDTADPEDPSGSRLVLGYAQVGLSRTSLLASILPAIGTSVAIAVLFVLLCLVFSRYITRRITAPFSVIMRMADDISTGRAVKELGLQGTGEFKEIVVVLNNIIGDLNKHKTKLDVNHQLLSMKVEERTSQLSERNKELSRAVQEVTETKETLRQFAYYDSLTNLPNRRLFTEQLRLLLKMAKRNKELLGLLFLDLDNFKRINDSLGHVAGDLLLREVAKRLANCVRDSDVVAHYTAPESQIDVSRLGGDEFTVVLNKLETVESAATVAQRLLDSLVEPMLIEGHELVVTPSIGIAIAPDHAEDVDTLLKAADTAMYHAKGTGKNNFVYYSPEMDAAGVERLTLENDLRRAIERKQLVLHYQPQVDTSTGSIVGAEALMRWEHPEHGLVSPFKFIPLAEEMGLIGELGEWGLEEACRQMVALQAEGLDLPKVSVNVSALQFNHKFIERVGEVLKQTGIRPTRLELELTEGIMMDGADSVVRLLEELQELGVQLSIDDFGTGYSSLSYLSRFPLDELKIDRSFVVEFDKSESDASLVMAIIAMARSLGLKLVAEGVETHEQYQFLRHHGANVIQGYLFSKPLPVEDLKPMLAPGYFRPQISEIAGDDKK